MATEIKNYEGTDWESLYFKGRWNTLEVEYTKLGDGKLCDLEICIRDNHNDQHNYLTIYLDQQNIRTLIEHLQKQLI